MNYKVIIPARKNSKRLPGKNLKKLNGKQLIKYSIESALDFFDKDSIWINSDDKNVIKVAESYSVNSYIRPTSLAKDHTPTIDVLINQLNYFLKNNIICDALVLLQPTNPIRSKKLIKNCIDIFEEKKRCSLATFSCFYKKFGNIKKERFIPTNYKPGQRSQDLTPFFFENGQLYITKSDSKLNNEIITNDVYPYICKNIGAEIDIDYLHD